MSKTRIDFMGEINGRSPYYDQVAGSRAETLKERPCCHQP